MPSSDSRAEVTPDNCPDPSVHGSPFRYCPYCTWIEDEVTDVYVSYGFVQIADEAKFICYKETRVEGPVFATEQEAAEWRAARDPHFAERREWKRRADARNVGGNDAV